MQIATPEKAAWGGAVHPLNLVRLRDLSPAARREGAAAAGERAGGHSDGGNSGLSLITRANYRTAAADWPGEGVRYELGGAVGG